MEREILSILKHFGWDESFHIPVANEKNKLLECKVEEMLKKKVEATSLLTDLSDELTAVKNYYNDIIEQRAQNEQLLVNYRKQSEKEEDVNNDIQFEINSLLKDTETLLHTKTELSENNARMQATLTKLELKCKNIRENISWCQEIEQCWNECINEKNRDASVLEHYNATDNAEFQKLELKRIHLTYASKDLENQLKDKHDTKVSLEVNFEKTRKQINKLRKERTWLLDQWTSTGQILKTRCSGIDEIISEINILKQFSRNIESQMLDQKHFYKEQIRNNMEIDLEIRSMLRLTYKQQLLNEKISEELEQQQNQELIKRRELISLGTAVDKSRIITTTTNRKISCLHEKFEEFKIAKDELKSKLISIKDRSISLCDRIKQLESIILSQTKKYNSLFQERQNLISLVRNNEHRIIQTKDQLKIMTDELKHLDNLSMKLETTLSQHRNKKRNLNDILNELKQNICQVNIEINFIKKEKSSEIKEETKKRIDQLTSNLEKKKKGLDNIVRDLNSCDTEIKRMNQKINRLSESMLAMHDEKQNFKLLIDGGEKSLIKLIENNKEKEVTENKLRLKANHLENLFHQNNGQIQLLEKQKINLEMSLQERLLEVQSSMNVLRIQRKTLADEISALHRNIEHINNHINQHLKKYEIVTNSLEKDHLGEPLTISNYKVELVKTRYSLLEKGDDLDEKIRKAEKEIQAMENTLLLVDVTNNSLKKINIPANQNSKEYEEIEKLKIKFDELRIQAKQKKISIPEIISNLELLKKNLSCQNQIQQELQKVKRDKEVIATQLECDLQNQKGKLERVTNRLHQQKSRLKSLKHLAAIERAFYLKELQSINKTALAQITDLISNNTGLQGVVHAHLNQRGISLPLNTRKITC